MVSVPLCWVQPDQSTPSESVVLGRTEIYHAPSTGAAMGTDVIGEAGGDEAHENRQPYLSLNYIIALIGVFPSRS